MKRISFQTVPPQDLPRLESSDEFFVSKVPWMGIPRILMLNTTLAPTDDVNVRKAVSLAIDCQALVDTVFSGAGEPSIGMLVKAMIDDPCCQRSGAGTATSGRGRLG